MQPLDSSVAEQLLIPQKPTQVSTYETLFELSYRKGLHSLVLKSYFYDYYECKGMKWPGVEERLLHHWHGGSDGMSSCVEKEPWGCSWAQPVAGVMSSKPLWLCSPQGSECSLLWLPQHSGLPHPMTHHTLMSAVVWVHDSVPFLLLDWQVL